MNNQGLLRRPFLFWILCLYLVPKQHEYMNLQDLSNLIESSLKGLQVDPAACRGEKNGQWSVKIKDSTVWLDGFNFQTAPDKWYFQVMSPVFTVPLQQNTEIMTDLLEFAYSMYGCNVCKKGDWYYVLSLREADGLDQGEVDRAIDRVAHYSSDIYAKFTFKYPAAWPPKTNG